jgi:hypothetical protein
MKLTSRQRDLLHSVKVEPIWICGPGAKIVAVALEARGLVDVASNFPTGARRVSITDDGRRALQP